MSSYGSKGEGRSQKCSREQERYPSLEVIDGLMSDRIWQRGMEGVGGNDDRIDGQGTNSRDDRRESPHDISKAW